MRKLLLAGLGVAALVAGCSPSKQNVANVNGKDITRDELTARLMQSPAAKAELRKMIIEHAVMDAAGKKGIQVTDQDVNNFLQIQRDQFPPGRFEESNVEKGITETMLRQDARTELVYQRLAMANAKVSDESVKKEYDKDEGGRYVKPEWRQVGFIIAKDKADADKAVAAVTQGADFGTVASKFNVPAAKTSFSGFQWFAVKNNALMSDQGQPAEAMAGHPAAVPAVRSAILKTAQGKPSAAIAVPGAPLYIVIFVKSVTPGGKMPMDQVKTLASIRVASENNQINPNVLQDILKDAKVDVKMDQFQDLERPEVLLPPANEAPGAPPA